MRVVHLCRGTGNGGFIAAWRLHEALLAAGVDSRMVVRERNGRDDLDLVAFADSRRWFLWFRFRGLLSRILHHVLLGKGALKEFYLQWIPTLIPRAIRKRLAPTILHVHAADDGLWALKELADWKGPIVWTFHAYRDFSQGYIYLAHRLDKWIEGGSVGSIHDRDERFFAGVNLTLKKRLMSERRDVCIAPSRFVHEAGKTSGVFNASEHRLIRNCVPLSQYQESGRDEWRARHGLTPEAFVILAGAHSLDYPIKGFDLLVETARRHGAELREKGVTIALFGGGSAPDTLRQLLPIVELGYLNDDQLQSAYSGSDLFVIPSREDNFPNVIIEGLACGLPYVGFDTGGVGDMIRLDDRCGKVVPSFDVDTLGQAIGEFASESLQARKARRLGCRQAVESHCSPAMIAGQHLEIYHALSQKSS
jgi:glycosyltransferase involved in cell wall biosynthesis